MSITRHPLYDDSRSFAPAPVDVGLVRRLETSFRGIADQADLLAERFYARLFRRVPPLRVLFPEDLAEQRRKLVESLAFVVAHLRSPEEVLPALRALGAAHVEYGARPEHYPIVCEELVSAMGEIAGPAWDTDIERDWKSALHLVSAAMLSGAG
ncbi:MAG TPA: globin domain-containing protein [Planctomycetota bacterium]|jgi:nitric oxide dioxygenase|nr:globin domain-containing protein [Planctomycetota bacterium]